MNRRAWLCASASGITAAAAWTRYIEPRYFALTRTQIRLPGVKPRRILHLADIHMSDGMNAPDLEQGLRVGLAQKPDLICLTGDFVSTTSGFDRHGLSRFLRTAVASAPVLAVLGNHDGGAWLAHYGGSRSTQPIRDLISESGVRLLHNESLVLGDLTLVGVGDYWSGEFEPDRAFAGAFTFAGVFKGAPRSAATLLLCHNPDAKRAVRHLPWDLMLSGHTHGGQVRVPGITPRWAPVADKRFIAGLYGWENKQLFITCGLGSPKHVRAFCRPEISLLEIV